MNKRYFIVIRKKSQNFNSYLFNKCCIKKKDSFCYDGSLWNNKNIYLISRVSNFIFPDYIPLPLKKYFSFLKNKFSDESIIITEKINKKIFAQVLKRINQEGYQIGKIINESEDKTLFEFFTTHLLKNFKEAYLCLMRQAKKNKADTIIFVPRGSNPFFEVFKNSIESKLKIKCLTYLERNFSHLKNRSKHILVFDESFGTGKTIKNIYRSLKNNIISFYFIFSIYPKIRIREIFNFPTKDIFIYSKKYPLNRIFEDIPQWVEKKYKKTLLRRKLYKQIILSLGKV